jgi:heterodisulfide reductase subunit C
MLLWKKGICLQIGYQMASPMGRRSLDYDPARLIKVANRTHERLAVVNNRDPNTAIVCLGVSGALNYQNNQKK